MDEGILPAVYVAGFKISRNLSKMKKKNICQDSFKIYVGVDWEWFEPHDFQPFEIHFNSACTFLYGALSKT